MQLPIYLDEQIINLVESIRTPFFNDFFIFISYLGAVDVILFISFAMTIIFLTQTKKIFFFSLWIALSGSVLSAYILKLAVHRPRPLIGIVKETSFSFPSAHAVASLVLYGFIIHLISRSDKNRQFKLIMSASLFIFILLIGFSRLYLGVHYLSDVMAGYLIGGLWLLIGIKFGKLKNSNK